MNNEYISGTYEQVLNEVYPEVKTLKRGLLYGVIQIILGEEDLQTQEENLQIYSRFGIKSSSRREEDYMIVNGLIEVVEDKHPLIKNTNSQLRNAIEKLQNKLFENEESEIKWIIVGACILVGLSFCVVFLNKKARQREKDLNQKSLGVEKESYPIPAVLCLVVPAKAASTLKVGSNLNNSGVSNLIDNATYFLCSSPKEANSKEQHLELTNERVLSDSQREVYVRVNVSDGGRNLIDQVIPYALKTNLPATATFTIKQLACLRDLSGLELFNRI